MSEDEATVERLERARLRALVDGDVETARALHADDYELITPGGSGLTRSGYLDGIAAGVLRYRRFEPIGPMRVRVRESSAIVRYRVLVDIDYEGGHALDELWHTDYWEYRGKGWQAVWSQATRIRMIDPG